MTRAEEPFGPSLPAAQGIGPVSPIAFALQKCVCLLIAFAAVWAPVASASRDVMLWGLHKLCAMLLLHSGLLRTVGSQLVDGLDGAAGGGGAHRQARVRQRQALQHRRLRAREAVQRICAELRAHTPPPELGSLMRTPGHCFSPTKWACP